MFPINFLKETKKQNPFLTLANVTFLTYNPIHQLTKMSPPTSRNGSLRKIHTLAPDSSFLFRI